MCPNQSPTRPKVLCGGSTSNTLNKPKLGSSLLETGQSKGLLKSNVIEGKLSASPKKPDQLISSKTAKTSQRNSENEQMQVQPSRATMIKYPNGEHYEGEVANGVRHGFGSLYYSNGALKYSGMWKNNLFHGEGVLSNLYATTVEPTHTFAFDDFTHLKDFWIKYEGTFAEGKINGQGTIHLVNNEKFTGSFRKGKATGDGEFHAFDGRVIFGKWVANKLVCIANS
jgi:hypothetical protein